MLLKVMFSFWRGKLQSRKQSITCLSKKQMTWNRTPEHHSQFYQEFRNLRKRHGRISKRQFLKISRKLAYQKKKYRGTLTNFVRLEDLIMKPNCNHSHRKNTTSKKKLVKGIKISLSLTKWCSDILQQIQHIKGKSSDDSPSEEEGIVKFAFADVHGTLKIVLSKPYKNRYVLLGPSVFSDCQQSKHQGKISIG